MGHYLIAIPAMQLCMTVRIDTLQSNDIAIVGATDFVLKMKWRIFNHYLHP